MSPPVGEQIGVDAGARARVREVLRPGRVVPVFQPIFRLADGEVIGYEALARMPGRPQHGPDHWLSLASSVGLRADLEVACWEAVAEAGAPPGDRLLFVNTSPGTLLDRRLESLRPTLPERLVLELTEQDAVSDYEILRARLQAWSNDGVRLAIDDTGAGYSSLQHVLQLSPEFLKLDRTLVSGVDRDRKLRALVWSLVAFAREVGSTVIAEGVERDEEIGVLREAGVQLAQGFLLGRPGPPWPEAARPAARPAATPVAPSDRLGTALAAATTPAAAADAVCAHLFRLGQLLPSVYFELDGLLRCLAQRGYWQVLDGIPITAGIAGRCFRTGTRIVVDDATASEDFLEAAPGLVYELCVPLYVGDRVLGVLNVESLSRLTAESERETDRCAALLVERLAQIGVGRKESPLARLARTSKELAGLHDEREVRGAVVRLACEISGMDSAMLVRRTADGVLSVTDVRGPLSSAFQAMQPGEVARLASLVERVSSCRTAGDATGRTVAGTENLRRHGAEAVAVLPLLSLGRCTGVLVVAHTAPVALTTDEIEPLELLAAEAGRCLELAATVAALRYRASRDPLTGLENHSAFYEALAARTERGAVLIADIDGFKGVNDTAGHLTGDRVLRAVAAALTSALRDGDRLYRIGGDEFAAILPGADTRQAVAAGERLRVAAGHVLSPLAASLSFGVAVPEEGESPSAFVDRADRMLYEAKRHRFHATR